MSVFVCFFNRMSVGRCIPEDEDIQMCECLLETFRRISSLGVCKHTWLPAAPRSLIPFCCCEIVYILLKLFPFPVHRSRQHAFVYRKVHAFKPEDVSRSIYFSLTSLKLKIPETSVILKKMDKHGYMGEFTLCCENNIWLRNFSNIPDTFKLILCWLTTGRKTFWTVRICVKRMQTNKIYQRTNSRERVGHGGGSVMVRRFILPSICFFSPVQYCVSSLDLKFHSDHLLVFWLSWCCFWGHRFWRNS